MPDPGSTTHQLETYLFPPPASMWEPFLGADPAVCGRRASGGLYLLWFSRLCNGRLQVFGDDSLEAPSSVSSTEEALRVTVRAGTPGAQRSAALTAVATPRGAVTAPFHTQGR